MDRHRVQVELFQVLRALLTGRRRVLEISEGLGLHRRYVYLHLKALDALGIEIQRKQIGREVCLWTLKKDVLVWLELADLPEFKAELDELR